MLRPGRLPGGGRLQPTSVPVAAHRLPGLCQRRPRHRPHRGHRAGDHLFPEQAGASRGAGGWRRSPRCCGTASGCPAGRRRPGARGALARPRRLAPQRPGPAQPDLPPRRRGRPSAWSTGASPSRSAWTASPAVTAAASTRGLLRVDSTAGALSATVASPASAATSSPRPAATVAAVDPLHHAGEGGGAGGGCSPRCPARSSPCSPRGGKVDKGRPLLILEAMKMEHTITAPAAGTVRLSLRWATR